MRSASEHPPADIDELRTCEARYHCAHTGEFVWAAGRGVWKYVQSDTESRVKGLML